MPTSFSARFSACTPRPTTPEPGSGSRPFSASCTATAGASGPSPRWARGRCSFLRLSSGRRGPPASRRSRKEPMDRMPIQVLFIEDSEIDVELALRSLEQGGFDVSWECVQVEEELKRALSSHRPQAILSDFSMPGFYGMEALRLAREMAPGVPFIFVSGTIGEERAIEAIRLGATDYVLKDNLRRLGTALRRALAEARDRERVRAAEEERARLVEILEATSDYVWMSDPHGKRIYLNAAGRRLAGEIYPDGRARSSGARRCRPRLATGCGKAKQRCSIPRVRKFPCPRLSLRIAPPTAAYVSFRPSPA